MAGDSMAFSENTELLTTALLCAQRSAELSVRVPFQSLHFADTESIFDTFHFVLAIPLICSNASEVILPAIRGILIVVFLILNCTIDWWS